MSWRRSGRRPVCGCASLTRELAAAFAARGPAVNDALGDAAGAAGGTQAVLATLDEQGVSLQRLIAGSGTILDVLGRRQGTLRAALDAAERVLTTTGERDRELAATMRALPPFLTELRRTAGTLGAAQGDLAGAADGLRSVAPRVGPALREIQAASPGFRRLFTELPPVLAAADAGLPRLRRILRAASPALGAIHPTLREAIPVLELLGKVRDSAITTFAGVGQIHNGFFVGPGNRLTHYANGIITLWNESIGGWTKRLPSNRGNTYPAPGFLEDIARGGLRSYDCRHIGNRAYLPPFGGAPPCITQGPWTYDGTTRAYPHLLPAPP